MDNTLLSFKQFKINISALHNVYGEDLHNAEVETPEIVTASDVINAIERYRKGIIAKQALVDWVNVLWFTDLYVYDEMHENAISSVMTLLETIDEDDTTFSDNEYESMITSLKNNFSCEL